MFDYKEACPISKASSVLGERWTLQIIREMMLGATRFSEFQKYLPRMSPSLLNARLKSLEEQGIILRRKIHEQRGYEYRLTPAGQALKPVLAELGKWGMQYAFANMDPDELNLSAIIRDFAVALRQDQLPEGDLTVQFTVTDGSQPVRKFLMVRDGISQVCDENLGTDVDVYLTASLETLGNIWYGHLTSTQAVHQGLLEAVGQPFLVKTLPRWLGTSQFSRSGIDPARPEHPH